VGTVADTSLRALQKERAHLKHPLWLQRYLFFRKAKGIHGVHSPLAYRLATEVFMKKSDAPVAARLKEALSGYPFESLDAARFPENGLQFPETARFALWVENTAANRAAWLAACADPAVTLAIDCFDCGLLLRTPEVKEKQYLRQKAVVISGK